MTEGTGKRRWVRRLVVVALVIGVVAVVRSRQFAANEAKYAPR